jgi:hypothetical protein
LGDEVGKFIRIEAIREPEGALGPFGQELDLAFEFASFLDGQRSDHGFAKLLFGKVGDVVDGR